MEHERVQVKKYHHKGGEVLHLVFDSFYDNGDNVSLASDMKEILKNLSKDTMGLVLDFRNNTGGFMQQAVDFSHLFLEESIVVLTEYANGDIVHSKPHDGPALYKGPLVILTSRHTASAAEVVAAALKEYNVAMIIGDESTPKLASIFRSLDPPDTATPPPVPGSAVNLNNS